MDIQVSKRRKPELYLHRQYGWLDHVERRNKIQAKHGIKRYEPHIFKHGNEYFHECRIRGLDICLYDVILAFSKFSDSRCYI